MLRVTWRNLVARKFRLLLSAFAIILGVSFVSGTLVFTHALSGAFDKIVEGSTADVEVAYKGSQGFDAGVDNRTISADTVAALQALPEAAGVYPQTALTTLFVIGKDGKVVGGNGPPGLGFFFNDAVNLSGKPILTLVKGALPTGEGEVALETSTLEKSGYRLGDTVTLATPGDPPTVRVTLVGQVQFAASTNGATITVLDRTQLQKVAFGGRDVYTNVSLRAADGVSQSQLAAAATRVLPAGLEARTGDAVVIETKKSLDKIFGFIQTFLLVFAAIALFVGIFLILNTFSMLVAQRSRELALLRAMGASRPQVVTAVLLEALAVGFIGATVGLGGGYVLAQGLRALFGAIGLDLGDSSFPLTVPSVIASYVVGLGVTAVAGIAPSLNASRVPPVAAMRDDYSLPPGKMRRRLIIGFVAIVIGVALMVAGFRGGGNGGLSALGLGTVLVLVGASRVSPLLGRPVIQAFGVVYRRLFGSVGRLATENSLRDPRRTAATASALMIGLALMSLGAIVGASANASTEASIGKTVTSQFIISNVVGQPFSPVVAKQAEQVPGVKTVASVRQAFPKVHGEGTFIVSLDPTKLADVVNLPAVAGSLADFTAGGGVSTAEYAAAHKLKVGDHRGDEVPSGHRPGQADRHHPGGQCAGGELDRRPVRAGQGWSHPAGLLRLHREGAERADRGRAGRAGEAGQGSADRHGEGSRAADRRAEEADQHIPLLHLRAARSVDRDRTPRRGQHVEPVGHRADT